MERGGRGRGGGEREGGRVRSVEEREREPKAVEVGGDEGWKKKGEVRRMAMNAPRNTHTGSISHTTSQLQSVSTCTYVRTYILYIRICMYIVEVCTHVFVCYCTSRTPCILSQSHSPGPLNEPVDGAAVDQRGEHAAASPEGVPHRTHAQHNVQLVLD